MVILIAEDDAVILKTLDFRLRKDGYTNIIQARDGRQAIELINLHSPDLIISDILMPFASGLEILSHVKKNIAKKIPIIMLSAMGMENTVLEAFEMGADDFMSKPFSPHELSLRVKRLLPRPK